MSKYILVLLLPLLLLADEAMKCSAGKCTSGKATTKKSVVRKTEENKVPQSPIKIVKKPINKPMGKAKPSTVKQLFNVKTTKVIETMTTPKQINYGYIVAEDARILDVTAWFSGYVEKLFVDTLYQKVQKGQALASVYSPEVYKAKQDYLNAIKFNAKRPSANMIASAKVKLQLLNVPQEEIREIRSSRKIKRLTTLYAPSSGWVFEKNINQGSYINDKKRLYQIVDLSKVWIEAKLFQNELEIINKLTEFNVKVKGLDRMYQAKKTLLYPMLDPKEATATLRLTLDNSEEMLKPGMYAKLYSSSNKTRKLVIPRTAAMRKNGTWYAFLATDFKGEYEPLEIKVQPLDNKSFEVLSGLHKGDTIVNNALFMMDSDAQINSVY
ncbi:MAG TPA: efflux RND transporter periplasmic adaptor subunit [Epsilonproteobacteria bacterium]|nr:efflux RND transporter periplasmic adaptor subunit [Campylobacterota bacterium]